MEGFLGNIDMPRKKATKGKFRNLGFEIWVSICQEEKEETISFSRVK